MGFSVNVTSLGGLAQALDRRQQDMQAGRGYLSRHTRLEYGPGLLNLVSGGHGRVVGEVDRFLADTAARTAAGYALRIRKAVTTYRGSDLAAAARTDARLLPVGTALATGSTSAGSYGAPGTPGFSLPGYGSPGAPAVPAMPVIADPAAGPELFGDRVAPAGNYRPPPDRHGRFPYRPQWSDMFSQASLARDTVWEATVIATRLGLLDRPLDPYEALVAPLSGDWAGLYACGDVLDAIAAALDGCARSLADCSTGIGRIWTGQAATGCSLGLARFGATLGTAAGSARDIGTMYRSVAQGVHANAELLGEVVTALIDHAVGVAETIGSGGLLAPVAATSAVRSVAVLAVRAVRMVADIRTLVEAGGTALTSAANHFGIIGAGAGMPAPLDDFPAMPAPGTARYE